ncbi:MAG: DNA adenine methylase [Aquabacterium sp.]
MSATQRAPLPRPALRWHGGKWRLAPWIIEHFPAHRVYVEPFGGAASVLLRKPRSYAEIYNDLDGEVVSLFRVLRDPSLAAQLQQQLGLTPFARSEWLAAYDWCADPVEQARRLIVRSFMGYGSDATRRDLTTGFRSNSTRSGTTPARDWLNYPELLPGLTDRLAGVVVENRPAAEVMARHDGPDVLHYVDPPYMRSTRNISHRGHGYNHELNDEDHRILLRQLRSLRGAVIVSGYPHPLYDAGLPDWSRVERTAHADGARLRKEVLWLNHAAAQQRQPSLRLVQA